ncbi:hypothetical protein U3516DRAFT_846084 [Neocallimastix sp. 'constans']
MVNYRYLNNYRDNNINNIFLRRSNKFSVKKEEDLNDYFKNNIITTIGNKPKYSFLKNILEIKSCNLLNCKLVLNGNEVEFENGKLITTTEIVNNDVDIKILKELIEAETKEIREMIVLPLTLNANLSTLGYIMDVELLKIVSFYDKNNIERLSKYLISKFKEFNDSDDDYNPIYPSFPGETIDPSSIYLYYSQWLHYLDHSPDYDKKSLIPKSYQWGMKKLDQEEESNSNFLSEISVGDSNEKKLKIISYGDEEEFCQSMMVLMQSSENFVEEDVQDINTFMIKVIDHEKYIPKPILNLENLAHVTNSYLNYFRGKNLPFNTIYSWFSHFNISYDEVLIIALAFSNHFNVASNLKKYRKFEYLSDTHQKILMKFLNDCSGTHRYNEFLKKKKVWSRLCGTIYTDNFMKEYPELVKDLLRISKEDVFNFISINRYHKYIDFDEDKEEGSGNNSSRGNLDDLYKKEIEKALKSNSEFLSSVTFKSCNLLSSIITVNGTDYEFENGKLLLDEEEEEEDEEQTNEKENENNSKSKEELFMKPLKSLMNKATKLIRQKLNIVLSLNENISKLGFCMDIPLLKKIAVYDEYEIEEIYQLISSELENITCSRINYMPPYYNFPRNHLSIELTYKSYCKWLLSLELLNYDPNMIPTNYRTRFEQYHDAEVIENEVRNIKLKTLSIGHKDEFYQVMIHLMSASEAISKEDIMDLHSFIKYEENRLKYIPEMIPNKENLANIIYRLVLYCMTESPPLETILPYYTNVNDVLRLALVMSGNQASDLGRSVKFKSFKNSERRILMTLLNNCRNRYEDFMKYKNMWERFCERVHPSKFKNLYPDLINDLLGSYRILGTPEHKKIRMEYRFYLSLYELDDRFKEYKEKVRVSDLFNISEHQAFLKKFNSIETMPKDIREYIHQYLLTIAGVAYSNLLVIINNNFLNNSNCIYWDSEKRKNMVKKNYEMVYEGLPEILIHHNETILPTLRRELLEKRIQELQPFILKLNKQNLQYKKERPTFNSQWTEFMVNQQINEAAHLLSQKPGVYLRHLDELITKSQNEEEIKEIITFLEKVAQKASVKVLLSVMGYFQNRIGKKMNMRAFLIKSNDNSKSNNKKERGRNGHGNSSIKSSIYYTDKVKEPLREELCHQIIKIIDEALLQKFKDKSPFHGVYISPELQKMYIPFDLRNASKGLENYTKGSRLDLSFKNITQEEKEQMVKDAEIALEKKQAEEKQMYDKKKKHEIDLINLKSRISKKEKEIETKSKAINTQNKSKKEIKQILKQLNKELEKDRRIETRCRKDFNTASVKWENLEKQVQKLEKDLEDKRNCPIGVSYKSIRLFTLGFSKLILEIYDEDYNMMALITKNSDSDYGTSYQKQYHLFFGEEWSTVYADIDIDTILEQKGRYIMINIGSGCCSSQFGWMEREFVHSDEPFEPSTVRQTIQLNYQGEASPIVLDCKTREFIWLDYSFPQKYYEKFVIAYHRYKKMMHHLNANNYQPDDVYSEKEIMTTTDNYNKLLALNSKIKKSIFYYFMEPIRLSIADLIQIHIQARGGKYLEKEEDLKDEDTAFYPYMPYIKKEKVNYINCNQLEILLSDYMK